MACAFMLEILRKLRYFLFTSGSETEPGGILTVVWR